MTHIRTLFCAAATAAMFAIFLMPVSGAGPSFQPDVTFSGSSLDGWQPLGQADWRAANGEITGTPRQPAGGWLLLDRSLQDVGFFASFRCPAGCSMGVLLRAEKTPTGMKGVLYALADGSPSVFSVTLDTAGRELSREPLRPAGGGQIRISPPPDPAAAPRGGARGGTARGGAGRGAAGRGGRGPSPTLPVPAPELGFHAGEWNDLEILLDANIIRTFTNNAQATGAADEEVGRFGPVALYVGGTSPVQFRSVAYKDLILRDRPSEIVSSRFRKQQLSDFYYSWGASADDFDQDGVLDVVSGPHIFYGPEYTKRREIYLQLTTNPSNGFATDAWMQFSGDFTGDGWADVINASFSGANSGITLYVNPKGESRRWDSYRVVTSQQTEIAVLGDVDGDGKQDFVYGAGGAMRWAQPDPANPTAEWRVHTVSEAGYATAHGVGAGDVNGDGRTDILNAYGWWEQPATRTEAPWTYHPVAFGRNIGRASAGGSVMAVYDANGDGRNDVVTSLSAHGFGLAWYEQKRDASGTISFVQHMIMDDFTTENAGGVTFTQPHGSTVADVDGDGIQDFIVGKRYWSHQDTQIDPNPYGDPVIYWYKTVRDASAPGGAKFVPELIHNQSGVGSHAFAGDLNRDGRTDIVTPTKFGTFIFWGQ